MFYRCIDNHDDHENVNKVVGLNKQNNNSARAARFLYISLSSLHDDDVKLPNFTLYGGREHKTTIFFLLP